MTRLSGAGCCHPGMLQGRASGFGLRAADPTSPGRIFPGTGIGMGTPCWWTLALPTAILSLCQGSAWKSQGGDGSILNATHWGQEPKHFYLPESDADSPTAPPGWGQLQPDRPLSSHQPHWGQGTTLDKPANTHTAPHGPRLPCGSPSSPATCLFLGSHLLPSGCSSAAELLASILIASLCWLLTTSTKAMPHAGQSNHTVRPGQWSSKGSASGTGAAAQLQWDVGHPLPWQQGWHHGVGSTEMAAVLLLQDQGGLCPCIDPAGMTQVPHVQPG